MEEQPMVIGILLQSDCIEGLVAALRQLITDFEDSQGRAQAAGRKFDGWLYTFPCGNFFKVKSSLELHRLEINKDIQCPCGGNHWFVKWNMDDGESIKRASPGYIVV
jgi:hypothetical protein